MIRQYKMSHELSLHNNLIKLQITKYGLLGVSLAFSLQQGPSESSGTRKRISGSVVGTAWRLRYHHLSRPTAFCSVPNSNSARWHESNDQHFEKNGKWYRIKPRSQQRTEGDQLLRLQSGGGWPNLLESIKSSLRQLKSTNKNRLIHL